ncbi:D-alanine-D-alanine ligase [Amycolatopsis sacchari]|uniref:D-alanine--D-alanine ligase n=1 Tax=Amycolatopsis sacchari TaxID=115433 RepID=A0A1I3KAK0_9PSEU|nr:D-alanine--D-alanine ligase family protein [Amycolatopsis sacchari]SFI69503.1 D-alanine-D-alanine ligase [Amycolatopsis sacchari]
MADRITLAVLFGGRSGEHEISCQSAASIFVNLDRGRYDVVPVKIQPSGRWTVGQDEPALAGRGSEDALDWLRTTFPEDTTATPAASIAAALTAMSAADLVFPALHGPYGEDGTVQSLLSLAGLPYLGNGVLASALGMDKEFTKKVLTGAGLAVAPGAVLRPGDELSEADRERLGLPVFVKPARAGSSLGVSKVASWDELPAALATARLSDGKVLVEAAVPGREVDIGVLEVPGGGLRVSPPLEILTGEVFFDYQAKYADASTVLDVPASIDPAIEAAMGEQALRAFRALDCRGLLRVDFFVGEDGGLVVNEVNTFPGFTSHSQYPAMWDATGLSYPRLIDALVDAALWYHEESAVDTAVLGPANRNARFPSNGR